MKKYRTHYIISKKNYEKNIDKFPKENNVLFITGLSGSGKTTMSNKISKKNDAIVLNLDCLSSYYSSKFENTLIKDITSDFFKLNVEVHDIIKNGNYMDLKLNHFDDYIKYNNKYFNYVYGYCLNNHDSYFIIEGTQLFMTINPTFFYDKSIIIIRRSALKSLLGRFGRQLTVKEKKHPITVGKKHIKKLLNDSKRLHYKDLKKLNYFISVIQKNIF